MLPNNKKYIHEKYQQFEDFFNKTEIDSKLEIIKAKNGETSLAFNHHGASKLIHSKYNPQKEAIDFINSIDFKKTEIPIIVGFGLGYHICALLKRFNQFERIFIIEPRIDIIKLATENVDLTEILSQDNISFISSNSATYIIEKLSAIVNLPHYHKRTHLIVHQPSLELYRSTHPELAELIQRMNVEPKMQRIMQENFYKNLGLTLRSIGVKNLFNAFEQKPALLISAGPSLINDLEQIKLMQDKCLIISVTTCLKLLLDNGIRPDIITIGDPKQIMESHFDGIFDCNIPLLFLPTVSTELLRKYTGPKIAALQNDYKLCDMIEKQIHKGRVNVGESVATLNLDVAIKIGCDPIIFVGQDLAFSDGHSHAAGIDKRLKVNKTSKQVENVQGTMVETSMSLMWFKDWIEKRIEKNPERTYINVSQNGARIKNTLEISLRACLEKYCQAQLDKSPLYSLFK